MLSCLPPEVASASWQLDQFFPAMRAGRFVQVGVPLGGGVFFWDSDLKRNQFWSFPSLETNLRQHRDGCRRLIEGLLVF